MLSITELPFSRFIGIKYCKEVELQDTLILEQWRISKGTIVKIFQSINFGYCILPEKCKDERGFIIPKRIFQY